MATMQELINKWNKTNNGIIWGGWKKSDNNLLELCLRYPDQMEDFWNYGRTTNGYSHGQMRQYCEYWGIPPALVEKLNEYQNPEGGYNVTEEVAVSWGFASLADLHAITGGSTGASSADFETQNLLVSTNAFDAGHEKKDAVTVKSDSLVNMDLLESNIAYAIMIMGPQSEAVSVFQEESSVTAFVGIAISSFMDDTKKRYNAA